LPIFLVNKTAAEPVSMMTNDGIANVENSGAWGVCEGKGEVEAGVEVKVGFDVGTCVGAWVGFVVGADVGVVGVCVGVVVDGGSVGVDVGVGVGAVNGTDVTHTWLPLLTSIEYTLPSDELT
jgi:hypothetical protein